MSRTGDPASANTIVAIAALASKSADELPSPGERERGDRRSFRGNGDYTVEPTRKVMEGEVHFGKVRLDGCATTLAAALLRAPFSAFGAAGGAGI